MMNQRQQSEIDCFLSQQNDIPIEIRQASSSSFTQQRDKLKSSAFQEVFSQLTSYFYQNFRYNKYLGFRLVGIDGSNFTVPINAHTIKEFGENIVAPGSKFLKTQVTFATDVLNDICLDARLGAFKASERKQAQSIIPQFNKNDLLLFDRGFFSFELLKVLLSAKSQFCFRLKKDACREVIHFLKSGKADAIYELKRKEIYCSVRFVKVRLKTGEYEYLMTSLTNKNTYSLSQLKHLYSLRWGIEEQFKDVKYAITIENFVGRKVNSIYQEFYANLMSFNMSMMLFKDPVEKKLKQKKFKHKVKANKRAILAKFKQCFIRLFKLNDIDHLLEMIIETLITEPTFIRNGRSYYRRKANKTKVKHHRTYVSVV